MTNAKDKHAPAPAAPAAPLVTILTDTREQAPLDFAPFAPFGIAAERAKLRTGDYSVKGYENHIFIERKSLPDLVSTLTHGRDRFQREVYDRGAFVPCRHLVVEAGWREISTPYAFSAANPTAIVNTLFSLTMPPASLHIFVHHSRAMCAWYVAQVAYNFARRARNGASGMWRSLFDPAAADLAPLPCPYRTIGE